MDNSTKPIYQDLVTSLDVGTDKGNASMSSLVMAEAYRYLSAGVAYAGDGKVKADYTGNTHADTTVQDRAVYALPGNALPSGALSGNSSFNYVSPIVSGCAKTFIIYISNGASNDSTPDKNQSKKMLEAAGGEGALTTIPLARVFYQDNPIDEWARFMKKSSLGVTTYTVDINKVTTGHGPDWTVMLQSMARTSSGKYFDVQSSGNDIADALNSIFSEIQSVNSVFASVSLPVSVNTQGTFLNQVYVGMFRPDQDAFPRWHGNLKQYKLGLISNDLKLLDADDSSAINSSTGFITECARSFWTPTTTDNYWSFDARGACLTVANSDSSNYPDGNIVEKGAQAYRLRNDSSRSVLTCSSTFASCTALTTFNTANAAITGAALGVGADVTARSDLINWVRGQDLDDENGNTVTTEVRASVHGDVVHSRPVAINYGTDAAPEVVVFYGGNDGSLRAVNGNRTAAQGSFSAGSELWSFMPPEFYGNLKRLYDNTIPISFPGSTAASPEPKAYGMDGPVTAYADGTNSWIYATMRRGGRVLYAFDVTTRGSPILKWKKGCPNNFTSSGVVSDTDCSTGFSGIGQTWSTPKIFKASGYGSGASPLLITGGGYDTCEDVDPNSCTSSTKGNKVYVLDANTGALLKTFDTDRSVVADVLVVPDSSGLGIFGYTADLGGNVYRITMGTDAPADWSITKIASLGCDTAASCSANRKFMFVPDAVLDGSDYVLLLGSGDREKPLNSYTNAAGVSNYFFMLRDRPSDAAWLTAENATCGADVLCLNSLLAITDATTPTEAQLALKKGWYLGLSATEQVVTSAITVFGVVSFSTHQPAVATAGVCSSLGETRVYNVDYLNAEGDDGLRYADLAGDGLPPSPVAGMVTLDDGSTVPFVIGGNPDSPLEGSPPVQPLSSMQPTSRVYWNIEN
jgi:type IV pilus assembly protein PilY1